MSNRFGHGLLLTLLLLASGCRTVPFQPTKLVPTRPMTPVQLVDNLWNSGRGAYLIRQSGLFELQGSRTPVEGVMRLDLDRKEARLVGLNDMGVKLFDLVITRTGSEPRFILPELSRFPAFTEAVAISVRRMFLSPEPSANDRLVIGDDSYLLTRSGQGMDCRFQVGGAAVQLLEKQCASPAEEWRVRYYEYQQQSLLLFPRGIVLDDELAGYRLTLWLESVERSDE